MTTRKALLDADWARLHVLAGWPPRRRRWTALLHPRFTHLVLLRTAQGWHARGYGAAAKIPSMLNVLLFGLEVPARLSIGPGLVMPHPQGIVLGASRIGANATIFQQVTLGGRTADFEYVPERRPVVSDNVTISAGAKVLGPVTLGEGATVGANAVVLEDVPPGVTAVGVPARLLS